MSRIIEIHRHLNFMENAQEDPEVKAWFNGAFRPVGPYWQGKNVGTGLTLLEQKLLMPEILGIESSDKDFKNAVKDYFNEILTRIPPEGLKLEIGLEDDNLPLSEGNMPLNIKDYVAYRHAKSSPQVAANHEEAQKNMTKKFYILDPDEVSDGVMKLNQLEDDALKFYFQYKDDTVKVDQILTMMGVNIKKMKPEDKLIKFKSFSQRDRNLTEYEQRESFNRFIDLCKDPNLTLKYMIQELIGAQVLEKVGTNVLIKESGQRIGENLKDAVLFLSNPKNSRILNLLKAEYQMKVRKDISFAPEEAQMATVETTIANNSNQEVDNSPIVIDPSKQVDLDDFSADEPDPVQKPKKKK